MGWSKAGFKLKKVLYRNGAIYLYHNHIPRKFQIFFTSGKKIESNIK